MHTIGRCVAAITVITVLFAVAANAQGVNWKGCGGWGVGSDYNKQYDPSTVETIKGEIVSIERITPMKGMWFGVQLVVKNWKEEIAIQLGPAWFIENQELVLEPREKVEIRGSRVTFNGSPTIIASEVKKGDSILKLRDEKGMPYWSGLRGGV
jgi:hypothetical protein